MSRSPLRRFAAAVRALLADDGLHLCRECRGPFVHPVEWETSGPDHWLIQLRCGACQSRREVRATNQEAKDFDVELDRQLTLIDTALRRLELEEMRAELDTLTTALDRDLIDPSDFAR